MRDQLEKETVKKLKVSKKVKYSKVVNGSSCCEATVCMNSTTGGNYRAKVAFKDNEEGLYVEKN